MKTLYETDFYAWTQEQADILKEKDHHDLDCINLIEEIESMGRADKRCIKSHLVRILIHMLKFKYQPARQADSTSWTDSINDARFQIEAIIDDSPSLRNLPSEYLVKAYARALSESCRETGLQLSLFAKECPWTLE